MEVVDRPSRRGRAQPARLSVWGMTAGMLRSSLARVFSLPEDSVGWQALHASVPRRRRDTRGSSARWPPAAGGQSQRVHVAVAGLAVDAHLGVRVRLNVSIGLGARRPAVTQFFSSTLLQHSSHVNGSVRGLVRGPKDRLEPSPLSCDPCIACEYVVPSRTFKPHSSPRSDGCGGRALQPALRLFASDSQTVAATSADGRQLCTLGKLPCTPQHLSQWTPLFPLGRGFEFRTSSLRRERTRSGSSKRLSPRTRSCLALAPRMIHPAYAAPSAASAKFNSSQ